jgi:hypothetical protein
VEAMMDFFDVYILTRLVIEEHGNVTAENVDVTFDIHEAEAHREKGVENDFEKFSLPADWRCDAETSNLVKAMRNFRNMVEEMQREALR